MKRKLILIFMLIVLLPTVSLFVLGIKLKKNEEQALQMQFGTLLTQELQTVEEGIAKLIKDRERELLPLTESSLYSQQEWQKQSLRNPYINQVFVRSPQNKFIYPNVEGDQLSRRERAFLQRTALIWQSGEVFYHAPEQIRSQEKKTPVVQDDQQSSLNDLQSEEYYAQNAIITKGKNVNSEFSKLNTDFLGESHSGWYTWFHGRGLQLILWKKNEKGFLIGFELNRARLIADVIAQLPTHRADARILLKSSSSTLYAWGDYQIPPKAKPKAQLALRAPLQSWNLEYYRNGSYLSKTFAYNLTISGIALALVLTLLCVYFYRENNRELRESSEKVNFVNQVSHELKTPLTNIRMYAELLEERLDETDPKANKQLGVIVSESHRLSRLINNVLSFARQDRQKLKLNLRSTYIDEIIDSVLAHFTPLLTKKGIFCSAEKNAPHCFDLDPDALEQILGNLLSNVEKYVPKNGQVFIESKQTEKETTITVRDNGHGVPKAQKNEIFKAFHRASSRNADGVSGTGIGLSISKELARLHGGDLILASSEKGATFILIIPHKGAQS